MKKNSVIKFSILVLVLLTVFIVYALYNKNSENYNNIKIDKSKYLVYTKEKTKHGNYNQYKPFVNIQGELGESINNNIDEYVASLNKDNICITYEYDLNGKVLSLVIKVEDHSYVESATMFYFRSYNINLSDMEVVTPDQLLNYFDMNSDDLTSIFNEKLKENYNDLIKNNLLNQNDCNYSCYLKNRYFSEGITDVEYYVRNGKLVIFKPYIFILSDSSKDVQIQDFEISN